jgi:CheY-like chemotaxis protein
MAVMRLQVVEDEVRMAALLQRGLSEEGYSVDVAGDGPVAVWRASERRILSSPLSAVPGRCYQGGGSRHGRTP